MDLRKMKSDMRFANQEDIDNAIKALEFKMVTESMTLKEEKKILEEIKQLQKNKPLVQKAAAKEQQMNELASADSSDNMKKTMDNLKDQMSEHFNRKQELSKQLDDLKSER